MMRGLLIALTFSLTCSSAAFAQLIPPPTSVVSLSGPRFGVTHLDEGVRDKLLENGLDVTTPVTQFGWQFEQQFYTKGSGLAVLNEWVVLLGGLEQGYAIPSLSWIVGLRTSSGSEVGFGPNITPAGVALAIAGGTTFRAGPMNVPVNVAIVPSQAGMRISFLTGFSIRR